MDRNSLTNLFILRRRSLLLAVSSLPLFAAIHYAAYWFRYDGNLSANEWSKITSTLGWVVFVKVMTFGWFRIFRTWNRYITFHDLVKLVQAVTVSSVLLLLAKFLLLPTMAIPRSVFLFDWGATLVVFGGLRSLVRFIEEGNFRKLVANDEAVDVLIAGVNDSGEALLRGIRRAPGLNYRVVGFLSEDAATVGSHVGGVQVVGTLNETAKIVSRCEANEVWITAGEFNGREVRRLIELGCKHDFAVKVLPSYEQLIDGKVGLRPRKVSIEDLLHRDPVDLDQAELRDWLEDRVVMISGSSGSIGSEICRQLLQFAPRKMVVVDRSENGQFYLDKELRTLAPECEIEVCMADITDAKRMNKLFEQHKPHVVFHAAAYKHVPLMEANVGEAVKNISCATRLLADLAHQHNVASFVMISTDKAVNPTSIMGTCKRVAELYVQALASHSSCRFVTVRFGNVLDSAGSVVPVFRKQIAEGGPVTVTHPDMTRYFMTIPEASQLVIQAGAMGQGGEIFVLDMGEPVKIVDLANDLIRLSGLRPNEDVDIEFVGIRPGEKLYEELHVEGERHVDTQHPKIMVAESEKTEYMIIANAINSLRQAVDDDPGSLVERLCQIVPQYRGTARTPAKAA